MAADIVPMAKELDTVDADRERAEGRVWSPPASDEAPGAYAVLRGAGDALGVEE